jgi:hypothetical protein
MSAYCWERRGPGRAQIQSSGSPRPPPDLNRSQRYLRVRRFGLFALMIEQRFEIEQRFVCSRVLTAPIGFWRVLIKIGLREQSGGQQRDRSSAASDPKVTSGLSVSHRLWRAFSPYTLNIAMIVSCRSSLGSFSNGFSSPSCRMYYRIIWVTADYIQPAESATDAEKATSGYLDAAIVGTEER